MKKVLLSVFSFVMFAVISVAFASNMASFANSAAGDDEVAAAPEIKGEKFNLAPGGNSELPIPDDVVRVFEFTDQWSSVAPSVNSFDAEVYKSVTVEFTEPLEYYFNTPYKTADGAQQWGGVAVNATNYVLNIAEVGSITDFNIQNTTAKDQCPTGFGISKAYATKLDGTVEPLAFQAPGWGGSMSLEGDVTSGVAKFKGQWANIKLSGIDNVEGAKTLRIYSNSPLPESIQYCVVYADDNSDGWPQIGRVNDYYAEMVLDRPVKSILLQWTSTEAGSVDIAAITYEAVAEEPVLDYTISPEFIVEGEENVALNDHSDVSVAGADALKVGFGDNAAALRYATYAINEITEEEDWFTPGQMMEVEVEVSSGKLDLNTFGYVAFEDALKFYQGHKYVMTIKAWDVDEPYADIMNPVAPVTTFSCNFNGSTEEIPVELGQPNFGDRVIDGMEIAVEDWQGINLSFPENNLETACAEALEMGAIQISGDAKLYTMDKEEPISEHFASSDPEFGKIFGRVNLEPGKTYFFEIEAGALKVEDMSEMDWETFEGKVLYTNEEAITLRFTTAEASDVEVAELTKEMFFQYNSNVTGEPLETPATIGMDYNVGTSNGMIYGLSTVKWFAYADVTDYDQLVLEVTEGTPRIMYNREMNPENADADGINHVEITSESPYLTVTELENGAKAYTYDLKAMAAADPAKPFVHINAIKGANWANATITSMKLIKNTEEPVIDETITIALLSDSTEFTVTDRDIVAIDAPIRGIKVNFGDINPMEEVSYAIYDKKETLAEGPVSVNTIGYAEFDTPIDLYEGIQYNIVLNVGETTYDFYVLGAMEEPVIDETITLALLSGEDEFTVNDHSIVTVDLPVDGIKATFGDLNPTEEVKYAIYDKRTTLAEGVLSVNTIGYAAFEAPINLYEGIQYLITLTIGENDPLEYYVIGAMPEPDHSIAVTGNKKQIYVEFVEEEDAAPSGDTRYPITIDGKKVEGDMNPVEPWNLFYINGLNLADGEHTLSMPVGSINFVAIPSTEEYNVSFTVENGVVVKSEVIPAVVVDDDVELYLVADSAEFKLNTHSNVAIDAPIRGIKAQFGDLNPMDEVSYAIYDKKEVLAEGVMSVNTIGYAEFDTPIDLYEGITYNVVLNVGETTYDYYVIGAMEEPTIDETITLALVADSTEYTVNTHSIVTIDAPINGIKVHFGDLNPIEEVSYAIYDKKETLAEGTMSVNTIGYAEFETPIEMMEGVQYNIVLKVGEETYDYYVIGAIEEPVVDENITLALIAGEEEYTVNDHSIVTIDAPVNAIKVTFGDTNPTEEVKYAIYDKRDCLAEGTLSVNTIGYAEFEAPITFYEGIQYYIALTIGEELREYYVIGAVEEPSLAGNYYIINKESGAFLTGDNSWGTQASVAKNGVEFTVALEDGKYSILNTALSCAKKYLGSNLYVDADNAGWNIEETEDGYYTISNEAGYIAQSATLGANNLPIVEQVAEVTDAALWSFATKEELLAQLAEATEPTDVTFLAINPGFNRNHVQTAWVVGEETTNKNLGGGANENFCGESWQSAFTISQTIEGLPNGTYVVSAQASSTEYNVTGEDLPVVFANDATSLFNISPLSGTMADGENSMSMMSESFKNGLYAVEPITVEVTDGTLTFGVKGTRTDTWCIWDNFQITYIPTPKPLLVNGDFKDGFEGWTTAATGGSWAINNDREPVTTETYAGWGNLDLTDFSMSQMVVLPAGTYKLTASAFYRYGVSYDVDPSKSCAKLYAGDESVDIVTLGSVEGLSTYANSMVEASEAFGNGLYLNELVFTVAEDGTEVEVGIAGAHELKQSWFLAGTFTLEACEPELAVKNEIKKAANALDGMVAVITDLAATSTVTACHTVHPAGEQDAFALALDEYNGDQYIYAKFAKVTDASVQGDNLYTIQLHNAAGEFYSLWGANGYLNFQTPGQTIVFVLGLNNQYGQDGENCGLWEVNAVDGGYTIKNVGNGGYYDPTNAQPSAEPVVVRFFQNAAVDGDSPIVAIDAPIASVKAAGIYSVSGVKVNNLQKGINIVVDENGVAKKIIK